MDVDKSGNENDETGANKINSIPKKHLIQHLQDDSSFICNGDKNRLIEEEKKYALNASAEMINKELKAMSMASLYEGKNEENISIGGPRLEATSNSRTSLIKDHKTDNEDKKFEKTRITITSAASESTRGCSPDSDMIFDDMENDMEGSSYQPSLTDHPKFNDSQSSNANSLYFQDGKRLIDYVLIWKKLMGDMETNLEEQRSNKRRTFEANLIAEGLELEREVVDGEVTFVKLHVPVPILKRYCEILKLRLPMRESLCSVRQVDEPDSPKIPGLDNIRSRSKSFYQFFKGRIGRFANNLLTDEKHFPPLNHRFTAIYSKSKEYLFDTEEEGFFTAAIRSRIVQFILDRQKFTENETVDNAFGIDRLVIEETYLAAYPLHDGEVNVPGSMRHKLFHKWGSMKKWYKYQPLDYIKDYFGVKIGLYFAWLGYYTYMLLLASIVGVICFLYSINYMKNNKVSMEVCNSTIIMCPLCDHWCDYWILNETCIQAKITSMLDNPVTVVFAIFMSFWATLFLELWKRYSAEITHRWDLTGFDVHEEHPRPEYLARLKHVRRRKLNAITNQYEPQVPFWRLKVPATVFSISVVLLLVLMAFAAVLGVVLYRMSLVASLTFYKQSLKTAHVTLITTATAASINLVLIFIFNWVYEWLAEKLTELELQRTQTEYDDSLTLKIYLLQFVNYYASIFYIAFFKGKFIGHPQSYNRIFNYRQEECGLGGCLMELMMQLAIIMVGKQIMNGIVEMLYPLILMYINSFKLRLGKEKNRTLVGNNQRWLNDLMLVEFGPRGLFPEYLEMVLQYGFVVIFVAAFPLAPLFALINNIFEMRLDAKKLLVHYRRPVSQRVRNIGVWYRILDSISKLSVITNGFIIAFTTDFIPRLIYQYQYPPGGASNPNNTFTYLNFTLSVFNTSHFEGGVQPYESMFDSVDRCYYQDFREPNDTPNQYNPTIMYWTVMAARFIFVVLFENIVVIVMIFVRWTIPDQPSILRDQIRREAYITNEIIIKQEAERAAKIRATDIDLTTPGIHDLHPLYDKNLSESQFDLFIHDHEKIKKRDKVKKDTEHFIRSEMDGSTSGNRYEHGLDYETKV